MLSVAIEFEILGEKENILMATLLVDSFFFTIWQAQLNSVQTVMRTLKIVKWMEK